MSLVAQLWRRELVRFLVAGGMNTLMTLVVYWLLLPIVKYPVAFTLSFMTGIFTGFALNTFVVFRATWSWKKFFAFPSIPILNYVAGLGLVWSMVTFAGIDQRIAPVISTVVTLPATFLLTRWLISHSART